MQVCSNNSCVSTVRDGSVASSLYQLKSPLPAGMYWWHVQAIGPGSAAGAWSTLRSFVR